MIELDKDGAVFVLRMKAGENRFNDDSLQAIGRALDEVEASAGPAALVTTGEGKFYSNGLDLDFMAGGADVAARVVDGTQQLLVRMLTFPVATVAACNGHTFAAGAMLAMAHDFRVMREDRGWLCFPEIDIKIPFTPLMDGLIRARLPQPTAHEAMVFGRRYTAAEALSAQIIQASASEAEVVSKAVALAQSLADKDRATMKAIKETMYADVVAKLARAQA
jgi:enoyl-CoA hydratase/carnithine racemase